MAGLNIGPLRWGIVVVAQAGTRRALVVSYEPFHRSGLMTVCPVTAARAEARYPGDVAVPVGEAGQTKPGLIICSQVRTISMLRLRGAPVGYLTDPQLRGQVRTALAHHLALDIPAVVDLA